MSMAAYKIRIIANACITRYANGEGNLNQILDNNYSTLASEDRDAVIERVCETRPDVVGNEVVERYDAGEGTMNDILTNEYQTLDTQKEKVVAYVYSVRTDIA